MRTLWVYIVGVATTGFLATRVILQSLLRIKRDSPFFDEVSARWGATILRAARVDVRYENAERLPREGAQILVANHQSWFDVFALAGTLPVMNRFVAKQELARVPVFGAAWQAVGHYSIDRGDRQSAIASLEVAQDQMKKKGHTVVMFPEGTRSATGELAKFKKGAFVLAIRAQVPVVPVAVVGSRQVMPKGSWRVRPGTVTVRVGRPIDTTGMSPDDRDRLTEQARSAVLELLEAPPGSEATSDRQEQACQQS